jgi:hypothetical protein
VSGPRKVRHVLQAESHIGATGEFSFMPWTGNDSPYPYMGWKLEFLDPNEPAAYLYLYPKIEDQYPRIEVYFGHRGDHRHDKYIGDLEGRQSDE